MNTVTLIDNRTGKKYDFDILSSTLGPDVIDVRKLYTSIGMFTYDPGFTSTASCSSTITYIDGDKGELRYRGYDITDLATKKSYLDVCYLLLNEKLPPKTQLTAFDNELRKRSFIHEGLKGLFNAFPDRAHPMAMMSSAVSALSTFYYEHLNVANKEEALVMAHRIIAKIPTLAAFTYRRSLGIPYIYPDIERSFTENFLYMMRAYPGENLEIRDVEIRALDTIFTLHADHEQNASTSTVRSVASTGAHPYAAISAGINALWGRAHGGANESVIAQLEMIADVKNVDAFIARAKDSNDEFRLMGFGHRVYKNYDPRAKLMRATCYEVLEELGLHDDKLFKLALALEQLALEDPYFKEKKLYPNVDFYSGIVLHALGIPTNMFTAIFAMGRTIGWIAHWDEMISDPEQRIGRPRQLFVGATQRDLPPQHR